MCQYYTPGKKKDKKKRTKPKMSKHQAFDCLKRKIIGQEISKIEANALLKAWLSLKTIRKIIVQFLIISWIVIKMVGVFILFLPGSVLMTNVTFNIINIVSTEILKTVLLSQYIYVYFILNSSLLTSVSSLGGTQCQGKTFSILPCKPLKAQSSERKAMTISCWVNPDTKLKQT